MMNIVPIEKQIIHFPQGTQADVLLPPSGTDPDILLSALALPTPQAVIMLAGGAGRMTQSTYERLQYLFTQGFAPLATRLNALIIDGGTQAGVMALIGESVAGQAHKPILLGVSPRGKVIYPGKLAQDGQTEAVPLDPNHSHFVLVETDEWGGETATMYALAEAFSRHCPSVAILANGGSIAKNEVIYNVRQHRPIIVAEGSGRFSDEVAQAWHKRPAIPDDPLLAEVIAQGDLHLFPLTGSLQQLEQLLHRLLQRQGGSKL
jgi:hypothetical protein